MNERSEWVTHRLAQNSPATHYTQHKFIKTHFHPQEAKAHETKPWLITEAAVIIAGLVFTLEEHSAPAHRKLIL